MKLQSRRSGKRSRPIGHDARSSWIEIRVAVCEIAFAQKRLQSVSHHLAGSLSLCFSSYILIVHKPGAGNISAADTFDIAECRVVIIIIDIWGTCGIVGFDKGRIHYMITEDGAHIRFVRNDRIADVIMMDSNTVFVVRYFRIFIVDFNGGCTERVAIPFILS